MKLLEQIQARNAILSEYNLATDEKVKPAHRKEFLGFLMVRAAAQGNWLFWSYPLYFIILSVQNDKIIFEQDW